MRVAGIIAASNFRKWRVERFAKLIPAMLLAAVLLYACGGNHHASQSAVSSPLGAVVLPDESKAASAPPMSAGSQVTDLSLTDNGNGTLVLEWHYRNPGDYTQDGTVNISDITPIAVHYNETVSGGENSLLSVIDGSGSGKIDIADITPLAVNFGKEVAGYYLQYADAADATDWTNLEQFPLTLATGSERRLFQVNATHSGEGWYCVTPYDASGAKGIRGVPVEYSSPASHWETMTVDNSSSNDVGIYPSLVVVDGNPAIAYQDRTNYDLMYVRATAPDGSAWGIPNRIDFTGAIGVDISMAVIAGNPAISYIESNLSKLKYVRATDGDGIGWGTPITVADGFQSQTSLATVSGYPAITYRNDFHPYFVRATAPDGSEWLNAPVVVDDTETNGIGSSLAIINGIPAISFINIVSDDVMYVRDGSVGDYWPTSHTADYNVASTSFTSLTVVNGFPSVAYVDNTFALRYAAGVTEEGDLWGLVTVDSSRTVDTYGSLAVINGLPAISYNANPTNLYYAQAKTANGSSWETPIAVDDTNSAAWGNSLAEVNGQPAIAYYDSVHMCLKYARYVP